MKNIAHHFLKQASAVAVIWIVASTALAAERPAKFAVPDTQIQALGIQTAPLQSLSGALKATFPAQVVVPATADQVVSSPVAGLVVQLLVRENQPVRPGTPLVRIASPELGQLQLQLLQTTSRARLARQAAQREQQLFDEGIIAQRRVQESQAALMEADAALNQARAALRLSGMTAAAITGIAATGKAQDGVTLTAMQSGIVTEIGVKPGQRIDAATALLHVARLDSLWLEIQLPVSESKSWPAGTQVNVQNRNVTARIQSVSPMVSPGSQTVLLRAIINGKSGAANGLRPGEFVTVELPVAATQGEQDVPLSAVARDGNQAYVFVRTTDGFEARPVKVMASAAQRMRVQAAFKADEQIAVSGIVALKGAWLDGKGAK